MRRILLISVLLFLLSSCTGREPESRSLVTAAAFDSSLDGVRLTLEVMTDSGKTDMSPLCVIGVGDSFSAAMVDAARSMGRDLTFDHMTIAILGDTLEEGSLADALSFCDGMEGVTPALTLVCAADGGALLAEGACGNESLAHALTVAFRSEASFSYTDGCRLADVINRRLDRRAWAIPRLGVEAEANHERRVKRIGLTVYDKDFAIETLCGESALVWRMLSGYRVVGNLRLGEENVEAIGVRFGDNRLSLILRSGDCAKAKQTIEQTLERLSASNLLFAYSEIEVEAVRFPW